MSWETYAITGKVGLDVSPQGAALERAAQNAEKYRAETVRKFADVQKAYGGMFSGGSGFGDGGRWAVPASHIQYLQKEIETTKKAYGGMFAGGASLDGGFFSAYGQKAEKEVKGFFERMKAAFGRNSTIKESMELLAGGGVIVGLSFAGMQLRDMALRAGELAEELRQGSMEGQEMALSVARMLPVFGQFWQAGEAIREAITGEKAEIARLENDALSRTQMLLQLDEQRLRLMREMRDQTQGQASKLGELQYQLGRLSAPEAARPYLDIQREREVGKAADQTDLQVKLDRLQDASRTGQPHSHIVSSLSR